MKDRVILHCDLNNFFASVSLLYNPTLCSLPIAVCGSREERHGIVLAKNEIAKSYGVKTAEAIWEAKQKCPELVLLKPMYSEYKKYSAAARNIYSRYTDLIEPFGIDECWLDVTGSDLLFGGGERIAERIRREIKRELGITVSVGVSFNKIFAKLGSDMKKPDGTTVILREDFKQKVWPLPVESLLFVGKNTAAKLKGLGVFTIRDVALCSDATLTRLLGKNGIQLKNYALGNDSSPVIAPAEGDKPKSVGRSVTCGRDFTEDRQVWRTFLELAEDISASLRRCGLYAGGVQVHTRTDKLIVKEYSRKLENPTNAALIIARKGYALFKENRGCQNPLRSVGLRAVNLKNSEIMVQQDIFGSFADERREEQLEDSLFALRDRFGQNSIFRGRILEKENTLQG